MSASAPHEHGADRIGPTAHYTAYVWRRLGLPYAEHFATQQGALLYWGFFVLGEWTTRVLPSVPSMREFLEYRHRLIDAVVEELRPACMVELGAGLTRRAVTQAIDRGVPGIEFDLPAMASIKRRRVAQMPRRLREQLATLHAVHDADVLDPEFSTRLAGCLRGHTRVVVIAEGLLSYFDLESRRRVIGAVGKALREVGGGVLVCDLHTASAQARVGRAAVVLRGAIAILTRRRRALDPFADFDELEEAFAAAGFDGCEEVQAEDHMTREPRLRNLRSPAHVVAAWIGRDLAPRRCSA